MQSLRRSLRGSMRQRRNSTIGSGHRGRIDESLNVETAERSRSKSVNAQRPRANSEPASSLLESSSQAADTQVRNMKEGLENHRVSE